MTVARTSDLLSIVGGESAAVGRAVDYLNLNEKPGRGGSRVFNFPESLQIVVYIQLAKRANPTIARKVALALQDGINGLPKNPVAVIGEKGLVAWKSANAKDTETVEHFKPVDPFIVFYRLPLEAVRQIFEPVPA